MERINQLDHDASSLAEELAATILAALAECDREAAKVQTDCDAASSAVTDARHVACESQRQLDLAETKLAAARMDQAGQQGGRAKLLKLQQDVAAAEEHLRLLQEQHARRKELASQQETLDGRLMVLSARRADALEKLERYRACQQGLMSSTGQTGGGMLSVLSAETQQLPAAIEGKQQALVQHATALQQHRARVAQLVGEQRRLETQQAAQLPSCPAHPGDEQALTGLHERLAALRQQEHTLRQQTGVWGARLGSSAGSAGWRLVHECFSIREPAMCQEYATALQLLTDGKLSVAVADDTEVAGRLLAAGCRARIWPLDILEARDSTARQKAAAANFDAGMFTAMCYNTPSALTKLGLCLQARWCCRWICSTVIQSSDRPSFVRLGTLSSLQVIAVCCPLARLSLGAQLTSQVSDSLQSLSDCCISLVCHLSRSTARSPRAARFRSVAVWLLSGC